MGTPERHSWISTACTSNTNFPSIAERAKDLNQEYESRVNKIKLATEEEDTTKSVTNQSLRDSTNPQAMEQGPNLVDQSQTSIHSTENNQSNNSTRDSLPTIQESVNRAVQNVSTQNSSIFPK